jgi:hypothetical protein
MYILRWLALLPCAIAALMIGSFAGGMIASLFGIFGQAVADTGSAFAGPLAFVFMCCLLAPTHRRTVGVAAASLIGILALGTVLFSNFTTVEEFARLSTRERVVTPVAQVLGALYALFIGLPFLNAGVLLEDLWREIRTLGLIIIIFGTFMAVIGLGFGVVGYEWLGFNVALGVMLLGVMTWLFPIFHVTIRMKSLESRLRNVIDP